MREREDSRARPRAPSACPSGGTPTGGARRSGGSNPRPLIVRNIGVELEEARRRADAHQQERELARQRAEEEAKWAAAEAAEREKEEEARRAREEEDERRREEKEKRDKAARDRAEAEAAAELERQQVQMEAQRKADELKLEADMERKAREEEVERMLNNDRERRREYMAQLEREAAERRKLWEEVKNLDALSKVDNTHVISLPPQSFARPTEPLSVPRPTPYRTSRRLPPRLSVQSRRMLGVASCTRKPSRDDGSGRSKNGRSEG